MNPLLPRLALGLIVVALLMAGCTSTPPQESAPGYQDGGTNTTSGNQTGYGNTTAPPGGGGTANVVIVDNQFQPNQTSVASGGSLVFRNDGKATHSVTIQKPDGTPQVDQDVAPGASVTVAFDGAGTYKLRCKYHSTDFSTGQTGIITVAY